MLDIINEAIEQVEHEAIRQAQANEIVNTILDSKESTLMGKTIVYLSYYYGIRRGDIGVILSEASWKNTNLQEGYIVLNGKVSTCKIDLDDKVLSMLASLVEDDVIPFKKDITASQQYVTRLCHRIKKMYSTLGLDFHQLRRAWVMRGHATDINAYCFKNYEK